jgi:hypothetical protein
LQKILTVIRRQARRPAAKWWLAALLGGGAATVVIATGYPHWVDYVVVVLLGSSVGFAELVSRYRDEPWKATASRSALAYVSVNAVAALAALMLVKIFGYTFGRTDAGEVRAMQVLVAGFGAIAFFRTSLFVVRVDDKDFGIGPMTVLQVLLTATDRDVDRRRAVQRAEEVARALRGLTFEQVCTALPRYALTLMQNVTEEERQKVLAAAEEIARSDMEDVVKVNCLGLKLMEIVGQPVLLTAAETLNTHVLQMGVLGEVYPRLRKALNDSPKEGKRTVDVIGLTLYTAWPNLRNWIDDANEPMQDWTIVLRIIDPELVAAHYSDWLDEEWIGEARNVIRAVGKYTHDNRDRLARQRIAIEVRRYALVPALHGFRLGDRTYFISFVQWDDKTRRIARPHQMYQLLPPQDETVRSEHLRRLFDNWLERIDEPPA